MGQRYRRIEDQKPWLDLALNQDLVKRNGLVKTNSKKCKCLT